MCVCARAISSVLKHHYGLFASCHRLRSFIYLLQGGVEIIPDDPTNIGGVEVMRGNNGFMGVKNKKKQKVYSASVASIVCLCMIGCLVLVSSRHLVDVRR
jgi:hypothetical protein